MLLLPRTPTAPSRGSGRLTSSSSRRATSPRCRRGSGVLSGHHRPAALLFPLIGVVLVTVAIVVVLGPWWLRIARDLVVERQARIRAEERADMAARVHDSVLQTLALIQRRAGDPQQVIALARAQERELRSWLFDGRAPGSIDGQAMTLAAGIRLIQQDVEAQHGVTVEAVTVGDCELDDDLARLLAAGARGDRQRREVVRRRGGRRCSLRSSRRQVSLFVRDRGRDSTRPRYPATGRDWLSPSTPGWPVAAVPRPSAVSRVRAPRCR